MVYLLLNTLPFGKPTPADITVIGIYADYDEMDRLRTDYSHNTYSVTAGSPEEAKAEYLAHQWGGLPESVKVYLDSLK